MLNLEQLRAQIDQLDKEIIEKIAQRQRVVEEVRGFKQQHNTPVFDAKREEWLHEYHAKLSETYNVSIEFIQRLFNLIMDESKRIQKLNQ
jgi:chorismate mutase